jgi:hypothetical protein
MANIVYNSFLQKISNGTIDLDAAGTVVRCMLERSTSTYSANKDHEFVSDLTGFVECTVASYARQTVSNKAVNKDNANDRAEWDFDNVSFGNLESGQTVKGYFLYVQTGGNDASPNDDHLILYVDTATGLPATLGGGEFLITIDAEGQLQLSQT